MKKCRHHLLQVDVISLFVTRKCRKNPKKQWKFMKIATTDREVLHIFWTTWGILIKFSEKMKVTVILKVPKNKVFTFSLEDTFFEKPLQHRCFPLNIAKFLRTPISKYLCSVSSCFCIDSLKFRDSLLTGYEQLSY